MSTRPSLTRSLIVVHRWLGIGLCFIFLMWFLSGIGMMYWQFPEVSASDRLDHAAALNPESIRLTPAEAFSRSTLSQTVVGVRLIVFDGRPAYHFRSGSREHSVVFADTGDIRGRITQEMMLRMAGAWAGQSVPPAQIESIDDVDQWTIQLRGSLPLWKYSWPSGDQVYVSPATGDVVQHTTSASRFGAYAGPIPHWLYFTPLRKHGPQWSRLVIWLSALGTATAVLGLVVGISMYSRTRYRGFKRWHTILGLIFGLGAATWAFSGMLSMEPFPSERGARAGSSEEELSRMLRREVRVERFDVKPPSVALVELDDEDVREVELVDVAGKPFYVASLGNGGTRVLAVDGRPANGFEPEFVKDAITAAIGSTAHPVFEVITEYDRYYLDRGRELPLPVLRVSLHDNERTRYYVDLQTARVVGSYSSRNWMARWAYHGLHSLNFPWLYNHRPLWDIVVLTFMLGGAALSVTSVILAASVIRRMIRP